MADLIFAALPAPITRPVGGHERGAFKAPWSDTIALLATELDRINARNPTLFVDVPATAITRAGAVTGGIGAARTPGVRLDFEKRLRGKGDTWVPASFPCARYWTAQHNVRAIALTLGALRDVARWGATAEDQQYVGFLRLPGPGGVNTTTLQLTPDRAARVVVEAHPEFRDKTPMVQGMVASGLLTMAPAEAIAFAKTARNASHADAGGSDAAFVAVSAAYEVLVRARGGQP